MSIISIIEWLMIIIINLVNNFANWIAASELRSGIAASG